MNQTNPSIRPGGETRPLILGIGGTTRAGSTTERALSVALAQRIRAKGQTPFLHVFPDNPASRLYESIGFVPRRELHVTWLAPNGV